MGDEWGRQDKDLKIVGRKRELEEEERKCICDCLREATWRRNGKEMG